MRRRMGIARISIVLGGLALLSLTAPVWASDVAPDAVKFTDEGVMTSLTGVAGDPVEGAKIFQNRKLGNCLACHVNSDMASAPFQGNVGPSLDGVASRWDTAQLRSIVVNAKVMFTSETIMPGFYSLKVGKHVAKQFVGKTILTAQQVEDVVAYLGKLKK